MKYNKDSHIRSVEDIKGLFHHLLEDRKLSYHPDDDFKDYVNFKTGERTFTDEEAGLYNRLMEEAFEVCEMAGVDIYGIGLDEFIEKVRKGFNGQRNEFEI